MKLRVNLIDWQYPAKRRSPSVDIFDLEQPDDLMLLVLAFGNGTVVELYAEADSQAAIEALRGLAQGTGGFRPRALTPDERAAVWLYRDGAEVYVRGDPAPGYVFIDPRAQPERFS